MSNPVPVSPRGSKKMHGARWLLLIALCAVSMTSLALSSIDKPLAQRWLHWPIHVLASDLAFVDSVDSDQLITHPRSVSERFRNAVAMLSRRYAPAPELHQPSAPAVDGHGTVANPLPSTSNPGHAPSTSSSQPATLVTLRPDLSYVDLGSPAYTRFKAWVDQAVAGNPGYEFSASEAAMMYALTSQQKYCTLAVKMVEKQVSDAESRIAGGSAPEVARDSYLYSGDMISDLAATYKTCDSLLTSAQRQRWSAYAEQTIWNIWNYNSAKWGSKTIPWSGWSINNPGNNYYYSFTEATMYWALASGNQTWMNLLRQTKFPALQDYFAKVPGGGSNEGTGYGISHMRLFSNYLLWRDDTGVDLANANPHATNSIRYWVHATVPTLDRYAPIGDQARVSNPELFDYHRRLMLEARQLAYDKDARDMASWWLNNISIKQMTLGFNYRYDLYPAGTNNTPPKELLYYGEGTGNLFSRTGWDKNAMWVSFIGGIYNQDHAHQEQGGFALFAGDWLTVTENIWTHSGIQQGTPEHNVLRFERSGSVIGQSINTTSKMTVTPGASSGEFSATADLTPAYKGNSSIGDWKRRLDFAGRKLTVTDTFSTTSGTTATFQLNVPTQPQVSGNQITAGKLRVKVLSPANPTIKLLNWSSIDSSEYRSGWRIDISGGTTGYKVELSEN